MTLISRSRIFAIGVLAVLFSAMAIESNQVFQIQLYPVCLAQQPVALESIPLEVNAEQAIVTGSDRVWYEPKKQELKFPDHLQRNRLESRLDRIVFQKPTTTTKPSQWGSSFTQAWNSLWHTLISSWQSAIVAALALLVIGFLIFLYWKGKGFSLAIRTESNEAKRNHEQAKMVDLPFDVAAPALGLLGEARSAMSKRDFSRAIIYLYSHQLVEIDHAGRIRLQRGKTNRMYLREMRMDSQLQSIVEQTMLAFESVFFGRHELSENRFMECWNRMDEFQRRLSVATHEHSAWDATLEPSIATVQGGG